VLLFHLLLNRNRNLPLFLSSKTSTYSGLATLPLLFCSRGVVRRASSAYGTLLMHLISTSLRARSGEEFAHRSRRLTRITCMREIKIKIYGRTHGRIRGSRTALLWFFAFIQIAGLSEIFSPSSITFSPACNAVALRAGWIFLVGCWVFTILATLGLRVCPLLGQDLINGLKRIV